MDPQHCTKASLFLFFLHLIGLLWRVCQGTAGPGADPEGPADGERPVPRTQEDKTSAQVPYIY
jgi:hypothetical protein